ncbi:putative ABC transport system ATP-binding protein [Marinobacter daqiaonensis]|uniref:Putative ABC transport system ATP-binding protein n=1 Tax=Marinobacter daqiaonensis TaxID=650891 RepID=A0A1I6I6J2_9GAMM|nr:ABC transporter ATP-binding protein [Marinobacter daqiaonensis]SFR62311.1 putative ABC transport system ATP-binding protein [Marinobacter daqiaonensis]
MLSVTGLVKRFESSGDTVRVFDGLSFSIAAGRSLALTGPSGSGKSTLLNILCGLESFDEGNVRLLEREVDGLPRDAWADLRRRHIGVVFQDSNLMPTMTLAENVRLRAGLAGRSTEGTGDWLERLGLAGLEQRYPDQVSGGQRQRAALAMVFAMEPELVLADEPTGSLDRQTAHTVADALFRWQREVNATLVLATHDLPLADRCDDGLDLAGGA